MNQANCPICKTPTLAAATLPTPGAEGGLTCRQCSTCNGQWVDGETYFAWVEKHRGDGPGHDAKAPMTDDAIADAAALAGPSTGTVAEPRRAKLCPSCGRLLTRAKVGRGLAIQIDRCGTCAGFWFDAGEWDALCAARLHTEAHQVFSDAWQFEVQREDRRLQHERMLLARLGEPDWREIRRVKAWIESHPRRVELFAVLNEGREELTNRTGRGAGGAAAGKP